ncbi:hypothetical protein [Streptomyces sp. NPDC059819]|uniref:hypothetical protein n=1 Tax=Streptomyces sp. NPDC059819 TaxID=3346963 RepID=UPI003664A07B
MSEQQNQEPYRPYDLIPASEVAPEEIGALSVRYVNGRAVLVASGGNKIPAVIPVVDGQGNPVADYVMGPSSATRSYELGSYRPFDPALMTFLTPDQEAPGTGLNRYVTGRPEER